jgi:hypothetical protein
MSAASLIAQGYYGYQGWGDAAADADFRATGGAGKGGPTGGGSGGGSPVDQILNGAISSVSGLFPQNLPSYAQTNPFKFDEALATQASTAEYAPYYDTLLSQYTQQVETNKSRSAEDTKTTLDQLAAGKEYYTGTQRTLLDRAIDQTNKGYAGNGLFFSGAKEKDIQNLNKDYQTNLGEYNRQVGVAGDQAKLQNTRTNQDLGTSLSQYQTNIGQEKNFAIKQGVLQRQTEAMNQYLAGEQQYYSGGLYGGGNTKIG